MLHRHLLPDPSSVARFIRGAQIIAGLRHPHIIQIYDAGQQNDVLYVVMENVEGPSLRTLLSLDGRIPAHLVVEYGAQIADALDAACQERNVIHRDIKPENLVLDRWGKMKVLGFGLARVPGLQPITTEENLVGSLAYASPEQIWGKAIDHRSDIYALGVVLYEMVTGCRPFASRTIPALMQAMSEGVVISPTTLVPDLSPELAHIILTAMAVEREERYA